MLNKKWPKTNTRILNILILIHINVSVKVTRPSNAYIKLKHLNWSVKRVMYVLELSSENSNSLSAEREKKSTKEGGFLLAC